MEAPHNDDLTRTYGRAGATGLRGGDQPELVINSGSWTVTHNGQVVRLVRREFELLVYMVTHADHTLRRQELLNALWPDEQRPDERTIDSYVAKLRRKLGAVGESLIHTVPKVGYRVDLQGTRTHSSVTLIA